VKDTGLSPASVTFRLSRPPSVNNLFFTAKGGKRHLSAPYRNWRAAAHRQIMLQRVGQHRPPFNGPYLISLTIERCRLDLDNGFKAVSDALVHMGVIVDDSLAEEIRIRWGHVVGCEVTVTAWREDDGMDGGKTMEWTPELDKALAAEWRSGKSLKEIAARLNMTKGQVAGRGWRLFGKREASIPQQ
jgi:Holliday junction resolvase RusA-like endonuclease